jgi:hypothetical protein
MKVMIKPSYALFTARPLFQSITDGTKEMIFCLLADIVELKQGA